MDFPSLERQLKLQTLADFVTKSLYDGEEMSVDSVLSELTAFYSYCCFVLSNGTEDPVEHAQRIVDAYDLHIGELQKESLLFNLETLKEKNEDC